MGRYKTYRYERFLPQQVIMPEGVPLKQVRILLAEYLRFPGQGNSAQG